MEVDMARGALPAVRAAGEGGSALAPIPSAHAGVAGCHGRPHRSASAVARGLGGLELLHAHAHAREWSGPRREPAGPRSVQLSVRPRARSPRGGRALARLAGRAAESLEKG